MTSPDTIRAAFVTKLRAISSLVALLGNSTSNIVEYVEETGGDSFGQIQKLLMNPPKLLVMHQGTIPRGVRELWQHQFSLVIRVSTSPAAVFKQVVDGVPTGGSGRPMLYEPVVAGVHSMEVPSLSRRVIPISDQSSFDYWEITTSFVEM